MALNWKIQVASPILTQGMSFQVRYRKIGNQNWNNLLPNPTTNEFIIYNLDNGDYEAEIRTVCVNGDLSNPVYHTTETTQNIISASISWSDNTINPKSGNDVGSVLRFQSIDFNPSDPVIVKQWEKWNGSDFVFYANQDINLITIPNVVGANKFRLKIQTQSGQTEYSNVLEYTKISDSSIYITDEVRNTTTGTTTFKLHVEGEPFVGHFIMWCRATQNIKNLHADSSPYGASLSITGATTGEEKEVNAPVSIPVGVYDCTANLTAIKLNINQDHEAQGAFGFGLTTDKTSIPPNASSSFLNWTYTG